MIEINPRVNLYLFTPHPEWREASGTVAVAARDFQRAEKIAIKESATRNVPGHSFSILRQDTEGEDSIGCWTEIERYRDVEDVERLVFFQFAEIAVLT